MIKHIFITTSFIGFHEWRDAPNDYSYLKNSHRHKFNVYVSVKVDHNNRQVEFHDLKKKVDYIIQLFQSNRNNVNLGSCEDIAEYIYNRIINVVEVRVDEDGENGAIVIS